MKDKDLVKLTNCLVNLTTRDFDEVYVKKLLFSSNSMSLEKVNQVRWVNCDLRPILTMNRHIPEYCHGQ